MSDYAEPSADPADEDTLAGTLRSVFQKFLQATDDMLPAIVTAYDRTKNRAQVRPLVKLLTTDNRALPRAQIASIPVMQFGGGGLVLNFNLKPGDLGWIKASDRDISTFLQSHNDAPPNTLRLHSFQDAVFIPDVMKGWDIAGEDAENAVLQTLDGNTKIAIGTDYLRMQSGPSQVTLTPASCIIDAPTVIIKGIVWETHDHPGVTSGPDKTGPPE